MVNCCIFSLISSERVRACFQQQHDHADAQAGIQKMVKGKTQKMDFAVGPAGPVEVVQAQEA